MNIKEIIVDVALGVAGTILLVEIGFLLYYFFAGCSFSRDCVKAHNTVRKKHKVPDFELDETALEEATTWVQKLAGHQDKDAEYDVLGNFGQNIYFVKGFNASMTCEDVVNKWYVEGKQYVVKKPKMLDHYGHYTQIIWKSTTGVGCARHMLIDELFVVCTYYPAGNNLQALEENLFVTSPAAPLTQNLLSILFCFSIILWCF